MRWNFSRDVFSLVPVPEIHFQIMAVLFYRSASGRMTPSFPLGFRLMISAAFFKRP